MKTTHRCTCCGAIAVRVARGLCNACTTWGARAGAPASCRNCRRAKADGPVPLPAGADATAPQRAWTYLIFDPDGRHSGTGFCEGTALLTEVTELLHDSPPGTEVHCYQREADWGVRFWLDQGTAEPHSAPIGRLTATSQRSAGGHGDGD